VKADDTVVLTVVASEPEAAGIECDYQDTEAIETSVEDFIEAGPQEILVHEADLEAAKELLAAQQS
jgi:hypothetical protein